VPCFFARLPIRAVKYYWPQRRARQRRIPGGIQSILNSRFSNFTSAIRCGYQLNERAFESSGSHGFVGETFPHADYFYAERNTFANCKACVHLRSEQGPPWAAPGRRKKAAPVPAVRDCRRLCFAATGPRHGLL